MSGADRAANAWSSRAQVLVSVSVIAVVWLPILVLQSAQASETDGSTRTALPEELASAVRAYDAATIRNDVSALAGLVSDDYVLINSDSSLQTKQSYLDDFKRPGFKIGAYTLEQPIYKLWGETALVGGILRLAWTQDGIRHRRTLRIAHWWVQREGRWRIAYTQLTRVPGTE